MKTILLLALCSPPIFCQMDWRIPADPALKIEAQSAGGIKITSSEDHDFDLTSSRELKAAAGGVFEVRVRFKLGIHTRALPELACYDSGGKEIPVRSSLETLYGTLPTSWQDFRRAFPVQPGTASVRARIRGDGEGEILVESLELKPVTVDAYQTGMLITQPHPKLRKGLVLESNLGIVNTERITTTDEDGDGKWAVIYSDLDKLSEMEERGEDWRSKFEFRANEIYWSDGAVLKSDSVREDRAPDLSRALHFRMKVHPGPYRAILNDPGRAFAVSMDGKSWRRFNGGSEADLGTVPAKDGLVEFWVDACYKDAISTGPAYFDYVRLLPKDGAPSVKALFDAAKQTPTALSRGSVDEKRVTVSVAAQTPANWPIRCGVPVPRGELASPENAAVVDGAGAIVPSQNRAMAVWPDGSIKWLFLDFASTGERRYSVAYGNRVQHKAAESPLRVTKLPEGIQVSTGAIRFLVPSARFGIVEDARSADGKPLQRGPIATEVMEAAGRKWSALELPIANLRIEQAGPLHAVILAETKRPESGKASQGFIHRARIHAYANSPLIEIDYFIANADSRKKIDARSISMKLSPAAPIQNAGKTEEQGWVSFADIGAGVESFRDQGPKALRWGPGGVQIDLWAAEGGTYEWIQGVGKTHRILLHYGPGLKNGSLLGEGPIYALAAPEWYTASGVFGRIGTAAASPLPAVESTLRDHMAGSVVGKTGLGFENYGDHSSNGYVKGTYLWDNNEYDLPAGAMVHFVRTGDGAALRQGLASALHYLDVDTIHYSSKRADWQGAAHTHSHGTVGHHTADGPGMSHAGYVQGLIWYSYFTGDPAGIDGAKGIADWVLGAIKPDATMGTMERAMGHPMMTLTDVYEATWEDKYLEGAARLVDWSTKWEHPVRGGFLAPITEQPAFISGSPFCAGLLFSALLKFNSWANLPELENLLERTARWTLTDMWRPPAGIMSKGGSPRRGANAQNISTELRLMRHAFERTGDPLFLVAPRVSVVAGFSGEGKDFGTRSTGLVFNYLPWFLDLLNKAERPEMSTDMEAKPAQASVQMTAGAKSKVCFAVRNGGSERISGLKASFQPRLDFAVSRTATVPAAIEPGETVSLCYDLQAPERINLSTQYNRESYAQWTAMFPTANGPRLAHTWVRIELR